jgi:hypothetical protein
MRKVALTLSLITVALACTSAASGDPSGPNVQLPVTLHCDNGQVIVVSPGTLTNRSHQAFAVDSTSIFVTNFLSITDSTGAVFVLFDTAPGLTATGLVTCTGDAGGGLTLTARGFFTPRG